VRIRRIGLSLLFTLWPGIAAASPWTLPAGRLLVLGGFDLQEANSEFIDVGPVRSFPLRGEYLASSFTLGARLGITDRFELEASLPFRLLAYRSDPVLFLGSTGDSLDSFQDNIIDLSQTNGGVGDLNLAGRYRLFSGAFLVTSEVRIKAPTGYRGPAGTFGVDPRTVEDFTSAVGEVVRPDRVEDDVTLGDAQLDLSGSLLVGAAFDSGAFLRAGVGYNLRLGGAGDQLLSDVRFGQAVGESLLIYAGGQLAFSVQAGDSIGVTVAAVDPDLPAQDYGGLTNLRPTTKRLATDSLEVGGGLIWRVGDATEVNVGYQRVIWGRQVAATNTVSVGLALALELTN
jgi:hypothetical protein